jgi:hypothetical protein
MASGSGRSKFLLLRDEVVAWWYWAMNASRLAPSMEQMFKQSLEGYQKGGMATMFSSVLTQSTRVVIASL